MEFLAEQPSYEKLKSFDLMASFDMLRFDFERYGYVLPETRQRVYDEELSSIAEGVDRAAHTSFTMHRQNEQLVYFDKGKWQPYAGLLVRGLEVAQLEAQLDPRKQFLVEWAERDFAVGYAFNNLQPGEQMVWYNSYPYEIEQRYGAEFLRMECGLRSDRQMGFIYRAKCQLDGSVELESQTVDHSDDDALAAAMRATTYDPECDMDTLVRTYDGTLVKKYGGRFYAGRPEAEAGENAWREIIRNQDLIQYFLDGLEQFAASDAPRAWQQRSVEEHSIGVWKAFKNRLTGQAPPEGLHGSTAFYQAASYAQLNREVYNASVEARASGDVKTGCGGSISLANGSNDISGSDTFSAIFGKSSDKAETYKFDKRMYCVVCQAPPSKEEQKNNEKKMCGPCGICKPCDASMQKKSSFALAG